MRPRHSFVVTAVATALMFAPVMARAADQQQQPDSALAETLFQQAKALVAKGAYNEACPKLAESHRIDPGDETLLALAVCHEAQGKLSLAWSEYTTLANKSDVRPDRAQRARERLSAIEPKLAHLSIVVPDATKRSAAAAASASASIEILRDGVPLAESAWSAAIPTEPGAHVIEARAQGKRPIRIETNATAGAKLEIVVPPFVDVEAAPPATSATSAANAPASGASSSGNTLRVTGVVIGLTGLAAIGVGAYFGVRAMNLSDEAKSACGGATSSCSNEALATNEEAKNAARISNFTIAGGAIATVSGTVLYFVAPRSPVVPFADPRGSAGIVMTKSF